MNLILFTKRNGRPVSVELTTPRRAAALAAAGVLVLGAVFSAGAVWAQWYAGSSARAHTQAWQQALARQHDEIALARRAAQEGLDALATRLGRAHAHLVRLDALGQRLTRMADLDEGEFDFDHPPALGGPEVRVAGESMPVPDFVSALDALGSQLDHREQQLNVLENLLMNRNLQRRVLPAGRPVLSGWISSQFGVRNDPFTGQRAHHGGIDFAGRRGAPVIAVASGVVTYSGERYGYGRMVEINHGNGFATRYAHNHENLVRVGDTVQKGDHVALMGATGRATAPHVHFEVLNNGRVVNPAQYVRAD